jgi:hypothetical protein
VALSVDDLDGFWGALWEWFEIDSAYDSVLGSRAMPGAEWFPGVPLGASRRAGARHTLHVDFFAPALPTQSRQSSKA